MATMVMSATSGSRPISIQNKVNKTFLSLFSLSLSFSNRGHTIYGGRSNSLIKQSIVWPIVLPHADHRARHNFTQHARLDVPLNDHDAIIILQRRNHHGPCLV